MLNISPAEFVEKLVKEFKVTTMKYDENKNILIYSWDNKADCHKFTLWCNAQARKKNYLIW